MTGIHSEKCRVYMKLGAASVISDGSELRVSSGRCERVWTWTGRGFFTTAVRHLPGRSEWVLDSDGDDSAGADWVLPVCEEQNPTAEIVDVICRRSNDEGFTSEHLAFEAEIAYPSVHLAIRFTVWAYPQAPGLRTQFFIRSLKGFEWNAGLDRDERTEDAHRVRRLNQGMIRVDRVPCSFESSRRLYAGYFDGLQFRNDTFTEVLKEHATAQKIHGLETCDWAGIASVERGSDALTLVKESHKIVNSKGSNHDAGIFRCRHETGLENLGWGVLPGEIGPEWTPGWASWCLVHGATQEERETAIKTWDLIRYPVRESDVFVESNTWGSSTGFLEHRDAAGAENVLKELEAAADVGIDLVQIDDGWQGNDYSRWTPCMERYPEGWAPVRARAAELGIDLGLWVSVSPRDGIDLDALKRTYDEGGFVWYKMDFARLGNRKAIEDLMAKARAFLLYTGHRARINWDDTGPRYGYFFAREYGAIYPANRKTVVPKTTIYRPHTVLRDLWHFSRYINLLKILGPVQNVLRVDPRLSNARLYGDAYCVAIALFSMPTFFQQVHLYGREARDDIRPLLEFHHEYREDIRQGITYPVGDQPDGGSWTGFQNHREADDAGLLLVFRELANEQESASLVLRFAAGRRIVLTNLLSGDTHQEVVDKSGRATFRITAPPGFLVYEYRYEG